MEKEELLEALAKSVLEMDEELAAELSEQVIKEGYDAYEAIDQGLAKGMEAAGKLFEEEEYFVPELLMCSDAMNVGIELLKPYIRTGDSSVKAKIVIGVIEGDTHDIGKNLVRLMISAAGFEVIDLGRDVPAIRFAERAIEEEASLIMISSLMTTTMEKMGDVVRILIEKNVKDRIKVAVGGGPVSRSFADRIGADGYSANATEAVRLVKQLLE